MRLDSYNDFRGKYFKYHNTLYKTSGVRVKDLKIEKVTNLIDEIVVWLPAECEIEPMEVWNGIHGQTIAPAGTFEEIYNNWIEGEDDIDV